MKTRLVAAVCVIVCMSSAAAAQGGWTQLASTGPTPRYGHAMAYDSQRAKTIMFGGTTIGGPHLADPWEWDGATWTQLGSGPSARSSHAMAYDSLRGKTVLFGGLNGPDPSFRLGDTWEWDGTSWTQLGAGPSARFQHAMAYDSNRGRMVMFGGVGSGHMSDTWELTGTVWTQVASTGPSARATHAMAYDSGRARTVLFGGSSGSNQTWEWTGSAWQPQILATGPTRTFGHSMAYDSHRGRTVMFGGVNVSTPQPDTWEWDGSNWTRMAPGGPVRSLSALVFDASRGQSLLFGGLLTAPMGDTWEWGGGAPPVAALAVAYGNGCGAPALALAPTATGRPIINTTAEVTLTNIPSSIAFVATGWNRTTLGSFALPLPLAGYGMPGCDLLQSADSAALPVSFTGTTTATFTLPLPNWPGLIGLRVYLQGWAAAPGANPGNMVVSNGVEWVIGNS